jgi:hypothetical protein
MIFALFIYLFIYCVFNDAVSSSKYIALSDRIINESWIGKEVIMSKFKVQSQHLPGGSEE